MIYLDNAATSWPKPEAVYQAMDSFMRNIGASPGRSGHQLSIEAGRIIYETRFEQSEETRVRVILEKEQVEIQGIHPV